MMREVLAELRRRLSPLDAHADLPTSHLRLAQIIGVAWLVTGQSFLWPAPWLSPLAGVPALPWRVSLALISTGVCFGLVVSRFTRSFAFALAALIALECFACRTWVAHNRLYVMAMLVMISLSTLRLTWLPRAQVGFVFLLAAIDKARSPAWLDGRFTTSFLEQLSRFGLMFAPGGLHVGEVNHLARWLSTHVGDGVVAGWFVIALELAIALAFFFGARVAGWLNAVFHLGVFSVTGSSMGMFFFAGFGSSVLVVGAVPSAWVTVAMTALVAGPWSWL
jgi:hypothetical protein